MAGPFGWLGVPERESGVPHTAMRLIMRAAAKSVSNISIALYLRKQPLFHAFSCSSSPARPRVCRACCL